jgi:hypothetical protein
VNIQDIAVWSQILSSLAILGTLVYLAIEIKQNTNALNADSRLTALQGGHAELFAMMDNPEMVQCMYKEGELTEEEQISLCAFLFALVRTREFAYGQHIEGVIDNLQWGTELAVTHFIFDTDRIRDWWENFGRTCYSHEFVGFIDQQIKSVPPTNKSWYGYGHWEQNKNNT